MSALQKWSWFNLAVIALTLVAILSFLLFLGKGALGGFGFLGLLGFGQFFFRKRPGQVLLDERDRAILLRSLLLAYVVFWVVFGLAVAILCALIYREDGAVPVWVVGGGTFSGLMLVQALASIAILVQYAGGSQDAG